jgi:hypothetical protein
MIPNEQRSSHTQSWQEARRNQNIGPDYRNINKIQDIEGLVFLWGFSVRRAPRGHAFMRVHPVRIKNGTLTNRKGREKA